MKIIEVDTDGNTISDLGPPVRIVIGKHPYSVGPRICWVNSCARNRLRPKSPAGILRA